MAWGNLPSSWCRATSSLYKVPMEIYIYIYIYPFTLALTSCLAGQPTALHPNRFSVAVKTLKLVLGQTSLTAPTHIWALNLISLLTSDCFVLTAYRRRSPPTRKTVFPFAPILIILPSLSHFAQLPHFNSFNSLAAHQRSIFKSSFLTFER